MARRCQTCRFAHCLTVSVLESSQADGGDLHRSAPPSDRRARPTTSRSWTHTRAPRCSRRPSPGRRWSASRPASVAGIKACFDRTRPYRNHSPQGQSGQPPEDRQFGAVVYLYLARLAWPTSSLTLLVGHIVIATPYVIRCVKRRALVGMDPRLEEAAMSLGASRVQAFLKVTLPLLRSSLVTGAVFAFIISFSDINLALFLAGANAPSLPVHIFAQTQFEADPSIAAASALQIVIRRRAHPAGAALF